MRTGAIVVSVVVGPAVVAPMLAVTPPLASDPELSGKRPTYASEVFLSNPAVAGKALFSDHCSSCHGADGQGASAPALRLADPGRGSHGNRAFHEAVLDTEGGPHHFAVTAQVGFNELELMTKFLRETKRYRAMRLKLEAGAGFAG